MNILVVGGGKVVYFLARAFLSKGYNVTVINRHLEECTQLARTLRATIVHGDGSDPRILEESGAYMADALVAVTSRDQKNLVVCQMAVRKFQIPRAIALVNDPENEIVFDKLGIQAISPTRILSSLIEQKTGLEDILNLIPLHEGKINVTEILLDQPSEVIGKSLSEISLPENSLIASIVRHDEIIIPHGATILRQSDKLIVMTTPDNHGKVIKTFTGETA